MPVSSNDIMKNKNWDYIYDNSNSGSNIGSSNTNINSNSNSNININSNMLGNTNKSGDVKKNNPTNTLINKFLYANK